MKAAATPILANSRMASFGKKLLSAALGPKGEKTESLIPDSPSTTFTGLLSTESSSPTGLEARDIEFSLAPRTAERFIPIDSDIPSATPSDTPSETPSGTPSVTPSDTPSAIPASQSFKPPPILTAFPSIFHEGPPDQTATLVTTIQTTSSTTIIDSFGASTLTHSSLRQSEQTTSSAPESTLGSSTPMMTTILGSWSSGLSTTKLGLPVSTAIQTSGAATSTTVHNTSEIHIWAPITGTFVGLAGICMVLLLYRWLKQKKRHQANNLHPQPFDPTLERAYGPLKSGTMSSRIIQKIDGKTVTPKASESPFSELPTATSEVSASMLVTVPSSQLEETQRELRDLREIVFEMRAGVHTAFETGSLDTAVTPPPEYATGRGSSVPILQSKET